MQLTSITSYTDRDVLVVRDATALTASITGGSIGLPQNVYTLDAPLDDATTAKSFTQELRLAGGDDRFDWVAGASSTATCERDYGQSLLVGRLRGADRHPDAGHSAPARRALLLRPELRLRPARALRRGDLGGHRPLRPHRRPALLRLRGRPRADLRRHLRADPGTHVVSQPGPPAPTASRRASSRAGSRATRRRSTPRSRRASGSAASTTRSTSRSAPRRTSRTFGGQDELEGRDALELRGRLEVDDHGRPRHVQRLGASYMDIEDLQATVTAGSCSSRVIFNVPKARSPGSSSSSRAAPTDNFDFAISASYDNSELRSTLTSTDASGNVSGRRHRGGQPPADRARVPGRARGDLPVGDRRRAGCGYTTGTYQYVGSRFTQIGDQAAGFGTVNLSSFGPNNIGGPYTQNTFTFDPELPAYDIVNLRLGFLNEQWDVALFVNNVTDEVAQSGARPGARHARPRRLPDQSAAHVRCHLAGEFLDPSHGSFGLQTAALRGRCFCFWRVARVAPAPLIRAGPSQALRISPCPSCPKSRSCAVRSSRTWSASGSSRSWCAIPRCGCASGPRSSRIARPGAG